MASLRLGRVDRLAKGARVYIQGRLQVRTWHGPEGARCFLDVVATDLLPLDRLDRTTLDDEDHVPDDDVGGLPF